MSDSTQGARPDVGDLVRRQDRRLTNLTDGGVALGIQNDVVWGRRPVDKRLAEPDNGIDHHEVASTGGRICGEHDACGSRIDHVLHHQMHCGRGLSTVRRRPSGMNRRRTRVNSRSKVIDGVDSQHGVVLSRKGLVVAVFADCRGPHGHRSRTGRSHLGEAFSHIIGGDLLGSVSDDKSHRHRKSQPAQLCEAGRFSAVAAVDDLVELDRGQRHDDPPNSSTISASASTSMGPGW